MSARKSKRVTLVALDTSIGRWDERHIPGVEVWGLNGGYTVYPKGKWTRWFELHQMRDLAIDVPDQLAYEASSIVDNIVTPGLGISYGQLEKLTRPPPGSSASTPSTKL